MKVLNRPMFRYGGPIKEGIMSGIQEPRQKYNEAGRVFQDIAKAYAVPAGSPVGLRSNQVPRGDVLQAAAELGIGNPYKDNSKVYMPMAMNKTVTKPTDLSPDVATISGYGEIEKPYIDYEKIPKYIPDRDGDGISDINPEYTENKNFMNDIFGGPFKRKTDEKFAPPKKSTMDIKQEELASGKITPDVKLPGDDDPIPEKTKKEKVNSILEGLGYDRASKNALYDAMIKSGQRIARTGLSADNLVSDVIAETSQSYDKPEKLREAANLMQVQQDLKLDQIKASKEGTGQMNQNYNYFKARGYSDEDSARKAEGLATNLLEAKNKAIDAKLTGNKLTEYVAQQLIGISDAYDNNTYRGTINSKDHKTVSDFARSTDFDGAGVYTVKGRIIELDKNGKILKEEIVTSSTSDKKWWNFGKEE